jgi:membrane protease subunit (stomatin/prohibitin family)
VAPGSAEDLGRIQALATAERALQGAIGSPAQDRIAADVAAALGSTDAAQPGTATPQAKPKFCPACGHRNPANARFCMDCGMKFEG